MQPGVLNLRHTLLQILRSPSPPHTAQTNTTHHGNHFPSQQSQFKIRDDKKRIMIGKLLGKLVGDPNEKQLKLLQPIVDDINAHEDSMRGLTDDDLAAMTYEFKARINAGESLDDILPEAFAAVREASARVLDMRHFDVQMIGGVVLHQGKIAEMRTGEGKTLVATLAAYLNALDGKSVHVVTVNDYLAKRDAEWMGPVYSFMGLSVGCLQQSGIGYLFDETYYEDEDAKSVSGTGIRLKLATKREVCKCDIVYGTNNEFGFDYLRDNMVSKPDEKVQTGLEYAIIDEVDNILIDEARTPLLISGPSMDRGYDYSKYARIAKRLVPGSDFEIDEKRRNISLKETGSEKVEALLGIDTLYSETGDNHELPHLVENAVRAEYVYHCDQQYVIRDIVGTAEEAEIVIVDEFTGREMQGRRFSDGLHQALEAKEGLRVRSEADTYATITLQNYFRMYDKLGGMTGTASTEAEEFSKIYGLEVVAIPTNRASRRTDHQDLIFMTEKAKWSAVADKIQELHNQRRPVLVGTSTIEKSSELSNLLRSRGVSHLVLSGGALEERLLKARDNKEEAKKEQQHKRSVYERIVNAPDNAKRILEIRDAINEQRKIGGNIRDLQKQLSGLEAHFDEIATRVGRQASQQEIEGELVADAGAPGSVTVATSMAGRGTDIILGGNPERGLDERDWQQQHDGVIAKGGLFVLGTERHESRRIDNQLRGRCARQGDPGETQFFLSVEDDLVRRFGGDRIKGTLEMFKWDENVPVENSVLVRSVENAQQKVEGINFEIRKNLVDYDDVANTQRDVVYKMRERIVDSGDFRDEIRGYIKTSLTGLITTYLEGDATQWEVPGFQHEIRRYFPIMEIFTSEDDFINKSQQDIEKELHDYVDTVYDQRETLFGDESLKMIEHSVLLRVLDRHWVGHLTRMENMRQSIGLQAIGQRDPLVQYRTMSFQMFNEMNEEIRNEVARTIFHLAPHAPHQSTRLAPSNATPLKADALAAAQRIALAQASQQSVMSSANTQQGPGATTTVASVNAPTHAADGRRLSRRERRAIERENKKKQRSGAAR